MSAKTTLGDSDNSNEVSWRQSFSNPPVSIILQAEFSVLEVPFVAKDDPLASAGAYSVSTNNDRGTCTFRFPVPFLDEYVIWARVLSPNEGQDSFYVALNNQAEDVYDTVLNRTNVWQWTAINGRGGVSKPVESSHAIDPRLFLMSGDNEIKVRGREQGTGLDEILITNDRRLIPVTPGAPINLQLTIIQ